MFLVGSPLGLEGTVTTGIVSAIRLANGDKIIQTKISILVVLAALG